MSISEIKKWAKEKIKGKWYNLLPGIIIASIITGLGFTIKNPNGGFTYYSVGWIFYIIEVGLTYYIVNFITDKDYSIDDIFHFAKDFLKGIVISLLSGIFIFLWSLLFIIPGIIKILSYSLIPMIMSDEKYKDLGYMDILKLSEDMMKGHRGKYFLLGLSFIGWHILALFTLFILEIWIVPYQQVATTKFLYDVKKEYEKNNKKSNEKKESK